MTFSFVGNPKPSSPYFITVLAFRNRFTALEKATLELAATDNPAATLSQRLQAASVRSYLADLNAATYIDLEREDLQASIEVLEQFGLIGEGRAVQILSKDVQPIEKYYD